MAKLASAIAIALLTLHISCSYADGVPAWNKEALTAWINKYPTVIKNGRRVGFLEQAPISNIIREILPKWETKSLASYDVESPIKQIDNYLVATKCMPHNCPSEFAFIIVDLEKPRLWAGFFSRDYNKTSTRWYGNTDDYSILPVAIRHAFLAHHGD